MGYPVARRGLRAHRIIYFFTATFGALAAPLVISPHFSIIRNSESAYSIAVDAQGNSYIAGVHQNDSFDFSDQSVLTRLDPDGNVAYRVSPAGALGVMTMVPDRNGNLYAAGLKPFGNGLAVKVDPTGTVVYTFQVPYWVSAFAIGRDGSWYLTGSPPPQSGMTTPGVWGPPPLTGNGVALVQKLSPSGDLVWATFLDNSGTKAQATAQAIAVDDQGFVYVAGTTGDPNYPVTTGAFQCACSQGSTVYVTKLSPDAASLAYSALVQSAGSDASNPIAPVSITIDASGKASVLSTTIHPSATVSLKQLDPSGGQLVRDVPITVPGATISNIALDSQGRILMTGTIGSVDFAPGPGAFSVATSGAVAAISKANPAVITLASAPNLAGGAPWTVAISGAGGSGWSAVNGTFTCNPAGPNTCSLPVSSSSFGNMSGPVHYTLSANATLFVVASADDGTLLYSTALPYNAGGTGVAGDGNGGFYVLGMTRYQKASMPDNLEYMFWSLARLVPDVSQRPVILGIANAAESNLSPYIAPGEMLNIYGLNIGPLVPFSTTFDASGHLPVQTEGVQVEFNGIPAPILSMDLQHATVAAPFAMQAGDTVAIVVRANGVVSAAYQRIGGGGGTADFQCRSCVNRIVGRCPSGEPGWHAEFVRPPCCRWVDRDSLCEWRRDDDSGCYGRDGRSIEPDSGAACFGFVQHRIRYPLRSSSVAAHHRVRGRKPRPACRLAAAESPAPAVARTPLHSGTHQRRQLGNQRRDRNGDSIKHTLGPRFHPKMGEQVWPRSMGINYIPLRADRICGSSQAESFTPSSLRMEATQRRMKIT